jgi:membrane protease YdiL (CAAX protease family)
VEHRTRHRPDDPLAAKLRGFGPLGILAVVVVVAFGPILEPFGVIPALAWVRLSRTPWREIGFVQPGSWIATVAIGILFGTALKILMKAIVMPLLGAAPINQAYHYLAGNQAALPGMMVVVIFGAGFGEETVFRGFLFERLGKLFGSGVGPKAAIMGLVYGTIFAFTGRIFMLMIAHAAFDVTAVLIIYWNLESYVAHLVFK